MAMSRDDKYVAISVDEQVSVFQINKGGFRRVHLSEQRDTYMAHQGSVSLEHHRSSSYDAQTKSTLMGREISFSPDNRKLIIATHLGDHVVYLDIWNTETEPFSIESDYMRSVKLPPVSCLEHACT